MANDFPSASQRNPDLTNLTIIHTEIGAIETQVLIDRTAGLRETTLSNTLITSSAVGTVVTPINFLSGTTTAVDADSAKVLDGGSTFILNDITVTFFNQVDGTNGAPDAGTTNIIITSTQVGSGAVDGPTPITALGGTTMTVNLRTITFTDTGSGNTTQAQAVVDINAVLTATQGINATFAADVLTLTKTTEGTDLTETIDITAGDALAILKLTISTATPTGNLVFTGTDSNKTIAINAARTLNELVADINTNVATHGITASVRDTGLLVAPAERFVLRLTKNNNTDGTDLVIDATSTALILTELGLTAATTVITMDDIAAQFQLVSSTTNVGATVVTNTTPENKVELSTNIDSGKIEIDGPILLEGTTATTDETGAGFLTAGGTLRFGGTVDQDVVFGAADSLVGLVATINLTTGAHGVTASSYDTGVDGATQFHLRLVKSNIINGANILVDAGSTAQVLTDLGLTAGTTSTTFMGFEVAFGAPTLYIDLITDNIFFEDGPLIDNAGAFLATATVHGFTTGDQLEVISDGVLPSPLKGFPDSRFFAIDTDDDNLKIAQTNALAIAGTPLDLAVFGTGSFQLRSLLQSELYFEVWKGLLTDRVLKQHMDEVIAHFENLGYIIFRSTNITSNTTFNWIVRW